MNKLIENLKPQTLEDVVICILCAGSPAQKEKSVQILQGFLKARFDTAIQASDATNEPRAVVAALNRLFSDITRRPGI